MGLLGMEEQTMANMKKTTNTDTTSTKTAPRAVTAPATARATNAPATPTPKANAPQAAAKATHTPSREEIARRAYEYYERRGRTQGHDLEDWLKAESELRK
jgi:hypothetical protein